MARFYDIEGEKFPSVTTILNALPEPFWLKKWKRDEPNHADISGRARVRGTLFHYRVGCFFAQEFDLPKPDLELRDDERRFIDSGMTEDVSTMMEQFHIFAAEVGMGEAFMPRLVEQMVYNKELRYAGTLDLIAEYEGDVWVIDVKTGKSVYDSYEAQIAAYSKCIIPGFRMYDGKFRTALLRFHPDTNWQFKEMDITKGWKIFMKAYELFKKSRIEGEVEIRGQGHSL